ncbi:MAG: DUF1573 domain-containing protein [bacterium]
MQTIRLLIKACHRWAGWLARLGLLLFASSWAPPVFAAEPDLGCEAPTFDFGFVMVTQTVSHTFELYNKGDATAMIANVHSTCGCTTTLPTRHAVPPGETEPLTVLFDLKGRHGKQHRPVYVSWNSADGQPLRLMLTGVSVIGIEVEPACAFFSNVSPQGKLERVVRIYDPVSNSLFRITGVTCADSRFTTRIETAVDGRDYRLVVGCAGPREPGEISTSVSVETDRPDRKVLKVPIYLTTQEAVSLIGRELK